MSSRQLHRAELPTGSLDRTYDFAVRRFRHLIWLATTSAVLLGWFAYSSRADAADELHSLLDQWDRQRSSVEQLIWQVEGQGELTTAYLDFLQRHGSLQSHERRAVPRSFAIRSKVYIDTVTPRVRMESVDLGEFQLSEGYRAVPEKRNDIYDGHAYKVAFPDGSDAEVPLANLELLGSRQPLAGRRGDLAPIYLSLGFVGSLEDGVAPHTLPDSLDVDEFTVRNPGGRQSVLVIERTPPEPGSTRRKHYRYVVERTENPDNPFRMIAWHHYVGSRERQRCEWIYREHDRAQVLPSGWTWYEFAPHGKKTAIVRKKRWNVVDIDLDPPPFSDDLFEVDLRPGNQVVDRRPGMDVLAYTVDERGRRIPAVMRPGLAQAKPGGRLPWIMAGAIGVLLLLAGCLLYRRKTNSL